jgi:hypothetical protein
MRDATCNKAQFIPVTILKNGVLHIDGHMVYTNSRGAWLYVSEDGQTATMYTNVSDLINELYRRGDDDDFVVTGWDFEPYRFTDIYTDAYNYYNARFED